jgi:tetratricopeptide (TPR) repeat protein
MYASEDLRSDIRTAELAVAKIRPGIDADQVTDLLYLLDRIANGYQELNESGVDLRPEASRIETVHGIMQEKGPVAVRALWERGGLAQLRAEINPPPEHWWWYLDQYVAERKKQRVRRLLIGTGITVLVLAVLVTAYMLFLRPDEATRMRYEHVFDAEASLQEADYAAALESYQQAYQIAPDDPEVNLMIGIMYEALDRPAEAADQYAMTEALYETPALFLAMRSQKYSLLGWYDQAEADGLKAIEADDQLPIAYCALASAYEGTIQVREAIDALQTCADLARAQGQDQLYVIAASRLATMLQMPSGAGGGPQ